MTMRYPTPPRSSLTKRGNECTGCPSARKLRVALFVVLPLTVLLLCGCGESGPTGQRGEGSSLDESGSDLRMIFSDSSLASSIREALEGGATGLDSLSALVAKGRGIENLAGIGALTHLEVLDLSDNRIIDLAPLSSLKNLRFLDLANNRVEDVAPLGSMHSLEVLLLEQNGVLRNLDTLLSLTTLESVTISESGLMEHGASTVEQLRAGGVVVEILRSFSGSDTTGVDDLLTAPCEGVVESISGTFYAPRDLGQLEGRECFELTSNLVVNHTDLVDMVLIGLVRIGSLEIGGNNFLETVDLRQLVEVRGNFLVLENPHLMSLRLSKLQSVGRHLWINSNERLVNLEGLEGLESVGDWLQIALNERLVSLEGLESLKRVGGTLHIEGNSVLRTLDGLEGLESVEGDITIKDNPQLSADVAMTFVERLRALGFSGSALVEGNGP